MNEVDGPVEGRAKRNILEYGIEVLLSRHQRIRKLKRLHSPAYHGFRVWPSSWLLMDFFKHRGMAQGTHVMEVGCGWGLAGIYCAKEHGALVTGVDADPDVFPFLRLHADLNRVGIAVMTKGFDALVDRHLRGVDVLIGADICFWETLTDSLKGLIGRALGSGVKLVAIADPGRSPFHELGEHCVENLEGEILEWAVNRPYPIRGSILRIGSLNGPCV